MGWFPSTRGFCLVGSCLSVVGVFVDSSVGYVEDCLLDHSVFLMTGQSHSFDVCRAVADAALVATLSAVLVATLWFDDAR